MQDIFANYVVPKGFYICTDCGCMYEHAEKGILPPCRDCGGEHFRASVFVNLTKEQIEEKFNESIKLLAVATYLYETCGLSEFLNVISINLRLLLCDGEYSLLPRMIPNPRFRKAGEGFNGNVLPPEKLLENPITPLDLEGFLNQVVIRRPGGKPITVKKMIRASANKSGGAHVDTEMEEDFFISAGVSKYYFVIIAKYLIGMSGLNYDKIIKEFRGALPPEETGTV